MMHAPSISTSTQPSHELGNGGRLVSTTGRALPLLGTALTADAGGGIARVVVEQRFRNPHAEPLAVTYSLPLPADGAVSGFSFQIGARRVVGEIDRRAAARERYEEALLEGRSAALLEQDRSSLFTQEIGNVPPGEELVAEVVIDQPLRWLDEGAWEWRFPTVVAARYLGEPGRVPDAARVTQDVASGPLPARLSIACAIRDALPEGRRPESPSHAIEAVTAAEGLRVQLRDPAGVRLDRDVVVRWAAAAPAVGVSLLAGRPAPERSIARAAYGLLTVVPPSVEAGQRSVPRDLIVLLDTSGSMSGEPLAQAVRVASALVETLRDEDRLELIEFSTSPRRWKSAPVAATEAARREALAWLRALRASGGTEMRAGILEAMSALREGSQRQVVLVTDGMIGFESQVVAAICDKLPGASRLHTVGVGSAVNRSLTGPAARAGRGVEVVIGLGEDPERAAARLVARTRAPLVVELSLAGSALVEHAPRRLPDLFAGAPALVGVALRPEGGELLVRGRTAEGPWEARLRVDPAAAGSGSGVGAALYGREAVEDLELSIAAGGDARELDLAIERLGLDFQIATRKTSWVAISADATVDPQGATRRERQPQELPYGLSAEGLGLRPPMSEARTQAAVVHGDALRVFRKASSAAPAGPPPMAAPPPASALGRPSAPMPAQPRRISASASPRREVPEGRAATPPSDVDERYSSRAKGDAERASDAPPKGGLIGALKRLFQGEAPPPPPAEAPPPVAPAAPAFGPPAEPKLSPTRQFRGRIALRRRATVVIEVPVSGEALVWDPAATVTVELPSGRAIEAVVRLGQSTRAGTLADGITARLAIELPAGEEEAVIGRLVLRLGGELVVIEVG